MRNLVVTPSRLANEVDSFFNGFFGKPAAYCRHQSSYLPRVNINETADDVSLTFELPGMEKDDIQVLVKDDVLTVSGERSFESKDDHDAVVRREIRAGKFSRSFTLPDNLDPSSVSADYKNGLLVVTMARKEESKPKQIEVKVK